MKSRWEQAAGGVTRRADAQRAQGEADNTQLDIALDAQRSWAIWRRWQFSQARAAWQVTGSAVVLELPTVTVPAALMRVARIQPDFGVKVTWLIDIGALFAVLLLGKLLFLLLFERGTSYRTSQPVHQMEAGERMRLLNALLATPVQSIHSVEVLCEGVQLYESQFAAIRSAKHSVHVEAYILYPGNVADALLEALCERARSGVNVRLIVDAIGSFRTPAAQFAPLVAAGGEVYRYHPLHWRLLRRWNSRTHRNLLIVDGHTAFIGGAGFADHWSRMEPLPWRDCALRVTGPIVGGLQAVFAENWLECAGELLVGTGSFPRIHDLSSSMEGVPGLAVGSTPTAGGSTRARIVGAVSAR